MDLSVVILAAGKGTRMRSALPKVLHELAGKPLLEHVVDAARQLGTDDIHVVYGHGGEQVTEQLADLSVHWVLQEPQLGTGHAVAQALPTIDDARRVLVLYGDVPMIAVADIAPLVASEEVGVLTVKLADPTGYGRIIRNQDGSIARIVEHKDADQAERMITEINTGIIAVGAADLKRWVANLDNRNVQGEFYLTDVIEMASRDGHAVRAHRASSEFDVAGVNDRVQLAKLERIYQRRQADALMRDGATLRDPDRIDIRGSVACGEDCDIDVNVVFEGRVKLGKNVRIGPNNVLRNVVIGDGVEILANCVLEDCEVGAQTRIGPFARLRPEAVLADHVHIGNFVEIKKSTVASGSKVNHLTYIGDTTIGSGVNVGAGTITCNYDGANKHRTVIGDNAFIGSCTQLVAPVEVGAGATIGAGSTIVRNAPPEKLTLSRAKQVTIEAWKRPIKKPKS
ncbi:MAG: bifunctional UDP-N-acetylglucosamine diphosphorylase/glucosamine-1-phosphate N-acetyltransferase GlmU [Gammaproteobacteria bacterium]|nr:bifunctional UDP-N-acetylglucosamine diphosphorylase/glucosamine-1-phosphate N-acetyltransferase GlmU [Gammaproteobacteria bacterium]MCP5138207.1 bifunctional UDP-N-acetylglucosamine diphosphorylase/glucosamine-1-phosphate N-acetyltransferase GlmU [Gammaproteobacteria bacterium]